MRIDKSLLKLENHFKRRKIIYFFILIFLIYNINLRVLTSADNIPAHYIPISLIKEGNFDLNEYVDNLSKDTYLIGKENRRPYYMFYNNGYYLSNNSVIGGLFAYPIFLVAGLFFDLSFGLWIIPYLAKLIATILCVFSSLFIFLSAKEIVNVRKSLFIAVIFSFGSNIWTLASQDLWTHTCSVFFLSMSIYFLAKALKEKEFIKYLGFSLSGAFMSRFSNIVIILFLTLYVIFYYKDYIKQFFVYALPIMSFFLAYILFYKSGISNLLYVMLITILLDTILFFLFLFLCKFLRMFNRKKVFITILLLIITVFTFLINLSLSSPIRIFISSNFYKYNSYLPISKYWSTSFLIGFFGTLISPSRGLFIYSPIFIFSFIFLYSIFKKTKKNQLDVLFFYFFICVIGLILFFSKYFHWYGGWSYGYRMTIDLIPFLSFMLIPSFKIINKKLLLKKLFILFFVISLFIQIFGILSYDNSWNRGELVGCDIDICRERLWSIKEGQIFHYLIHPRIHYCHPEIKPFKIVCEERFFES
ncbi:MAG: hypothetical protein KKH40_03145 [Nanoarchaeota archaeon]|nr:hypothetical protein [Nanoarchaeota archaeon]